MLTRALFDRRVNAWYDWPRFNFARVAQGIRALVSGTKGRWFESSRGYSICRRKADIFFGLRRKVVISTVSYRTPGPQLGHSSE